MGDKPLGYYNHGLGAVFSPGGGQDWVARYTQDPENYFDNRSSTIDAPAPTVFSGTMDVAIWIANSYNFVRGCRAMEVSMFGNEASLLPELHRYGNVWGSCFLTGTVNFTAGIIRGPRAKYISSGVIELETISENDIRPDRWVIPALQMLPDIMSTVSVMNATSLAPWNDIAGYTTRLIRQSYSGIWDTMNADFNKDPIEVVAHERARVLQANVSFLRVLF